MNDGIDTLVGSAGIVDEDEAVDINAVQAAPPPAPAETKVREIRIKIPEGLPEQNARLAWQIGMGTMQMLMHGRLVISFPSMGVHPQTGQPMPTIGKFEMVIAKPEDVDRLIKLATVINEVNMKIAAAQANPVDLLGASVDGTKHKDEALRQLTQEAKGEVPIVTATDMPKGNIQIARR